MSTVVRWGRRYPFADVETVYRAAFRPVAVRGAGFTPSADVVRDGQDALVRLEVPGLDPEKDVTVEVVGNSLVIRGERKDERAEDNHGRVLREVRYGSFRRSFSLPAHVTGDDIAATYDKGVLTVRVAGVHTEPATQRIPVTAGTAAQPVEAPAAPAASETGETSETGEQKNAA
ncbi:MAG: Hsp20/alpha crystallin family protein [Frankia sp.]